MKFIVKHHAQQCTSRCFSSPHAALPSPLVCSMHAHGLVGCPGVSHPTQCCALCMQECVAQHTPARTHSCTHSHTGAPPVVAEPPAAGAAGPRQRRRAWRPAAVGQPAAAQRDRPARVYVCVCVLRMVMSLHAHFHAHPHAHLHTHALMCTHSQAHNARLAQAPCLSTRWPETAAPCPPPPASRHSSSQARCLRV
jgi:hypothetical protein